MSDDMIQSDDPTPPKTDKANLEHLESIESTIIADTAKPAGSAEVQDEKDQSGDLNDRPASVLITSISQDPSDTIKMQPQVVQEKQKETEFELAPLPTEFDPDAPVNLPQLVEDEEISDPFGVEDDLKSISEHDQAENMNKGGEDVVMNEAEEEDEGKMMEYITSLQASGPAEFEEEEEEQEEVENRDTDIQPKNIEMSEPTLMHAEDTEDTVEVGKDQTKDMQNPEEVIKETETRASSPLTPVSDIPELPDTLTFSPSKPSEPLPPPTKRVIKKTKEKRNESTDQNSPHAESSRSAQRRSASPTFHDNVSSDEQESKKPVDLKKLREPMKTTRKRSHDDDDFVPRKGGAKLGMTGSRPRNISVGKGKDKGKGRGKENPIDVDDELHSIEDSDEFREIQKDDITDGKEQDPSYKGDHSPQTEISVIRGNKKPNKRHKANGSENGSTKPIKGSKKRLDAASGIKVSDKPPEKITPRAKMFSDAMVKKLLKGKTKEVQMASCQRPRYGKWGKCTQCIAKIGGDSCRFRDFRSFPIDPETTDITGPGYFESTEWKEEVTPLPTEFNREFEEEHIVKTEKTVATMLLLLITGEARHVVSKKAIKRGMDAAKHRSVCDFCSSTIFGGWFFCKICGRDYCLACERYFPDSLETIMQSPWPMPDAARPRLLKCQNQPGQKAVGQPKHHRGCLQPVSRFDEAELKDHWLKLSAIALEDLNKGNLDEKLGYIGLNREDEGVNSVLDGILKKEEGENEGENGNVEEEDLIAPLPMENIDEKQDKNEISEEDSGEEGLWKYTKITNPEAKLIDDPAGLKEINREFIFVKNENKLNNLLFDKIWSKGEPIVVNHVDKKLNLSWKPNDFIEKFGEEQCYVVNCQTNLPTLSTVGKFFEKFKNKNERGKIILKLKDWPSTDDFKNTHPELYNDFCDALPVPDYTRREGVMNLYSHFPPGPTRPDIGPKMYNAFEARETAGGFGSTRLHMDVADAVNLLLYASPRRKEEPGCAVWDLFRAEDADLIREFLKEKFGNTHVFTDPIHSQLFYLDSELRKELYERKGVKGWRIYQYPGQAVFIPAGCAHQVCNLADCIKIALDFVSPHNVKRCQQLTQDFRKENFAKAWKEDVLQLYNVLWYSWLSCIETRQRRIRESEEAAIAQKAREEHLASLRRGRHDPWEDSLHNHHRLGSPGNQSWGAWNVSSVRDEPHPDSRSPSLSRGGSPNIVRVLADSEVKEGDKVDKKDGEVEQEEEDINVKEKKGLAEELLEITLKKEPPSSSETFLGSNTLWSGRKGLLLQTSKSSSIPPSRGGGGNSLEDIKPNLSARQLTLISKQKEIEEKEKLRLEKRLKNPPRELRTSTLIKLGAKNLEDVLASARADMFDNQSESESENPLSIIGIENEQQQQQGEKEEIWPNPNSIPPTLIEIESPNLIHNHNSLTPIINEQENVNDNDETMTEDLDFNQNPIGNNERFDIPDSLMTTLNDVLVNQPHVSPEEEEEVEQIEQRDNIIITDDYHEGVVVDDDNQHQDGQVGQGGTVTDVEAETVPETEQDRLDREELAANLRHIGELIDMDDFDAEGEIGGTFDG
ncbi:uncharacterized protein I206_103681 [Kwoniella pini CBS 10737]|uniref:JmjC domain-containing protein n=1 Tax=Kwoniella pini CBS 10737 TaxID=1296096 RepID=A0AAJ8L5E2_9TREE